MVLLKEYLWRETAHHLSELFTSVGMWAAAVHCYFLSLVLFHCFPVFAAILDWPGRGSQSMRVALSQIFQHPIALLEFLSRIIYFWGGTEYIVEMEFGKCWKVHKVRPNLKSNSCWKEIGKKNHLFFDFQMMLNNNFGLLSAFFFFFNQEGSFTYSVKRILKQNAKWNGIDLFFCVSIFRVFI